MKQRNDVPCRVNVRHFDHGGLNVDQQVLA
jgi:hypothetical protein